MTTKKLKLKKKVKWKRCGNPLSPLFLMVGGVMSITPVIANMKFNNGIINEISMTFYLIGGIFLLISLIMYFCYFKREVTYEEV